MTIERRLEKLEEHARGANVHPLSKEERDARYAAHVASVLPIAATCNTWQEFARYLESLRDGKSPKVVSLLDERQRSAATAAFARLIFAEAHGDR